MINFTIMYEHHVDSLFKSGNATVLEEELAVILNFEYLNKNLIYYTIYI